MDYIDQFTISGRLLTSIAEIDEFKGRWAALGNLSPERLSALKQPSRLKHRV